MKRCPPPKTAYDLSNPQVLLAWQRNHLANERTFLAWCRTGLALFAFSFVIERFDFFIRQMQALPMFDGLGPPHLHTEMISLTTFGVGVAVILMAGWSFVYVRRLINRGEQQFSALPDLLFILSVLGIIISLFGVFWFLVVK
jgi:putative membrane protein